MSQAEQLFWAERTIATQEKIQKKMKENVKELENTIRTQDQLIRALYLQIDQMTENFRLTMELEKEKRGQIIIHYNQLLDQQKQ